MAIKTFTNFKSSQFVLFWLFVKVRGSLLGLFLNLKPISTESTENQHYLTYLFSILYNKNVENVNIIVNNLQYKYIYKEIFVSVNNFCIV